MPHGTLLERVDCTQDRPSDAYFRHGDVRVVESAAGRYREAEAAPLSRFGYRFRIRHVGRPHVAVITYPDDRRRFMCVVDGTKLLLNGKPFAIKGLNRDEQYSGCPTCHDTHSTGSVGRRRRCSNRLQDDDQCHSGPEDDISTSYNSSSHLRSDHEKWGWPDSP